MNGIDSSLVISLAKVVLVVLLPSLVLFDIGVPADRKGNNQEC